MQKETAIKILKRYKKGLIAMEKEAIANNDTQEAEHYRTDKIAMITAIEQLERSNT